MTRRFIIITIIVLFVVLPFQLFLPSGRNTQATTIVQTIDQDTTWSLDGSPYLLSNAGVYISPGKTLTINPGVIIKLSRSGFYVDGKLNVQGEPGSPVIFTSVNDDSKGGKADGSNSVPQAGDWNNIQIGSGGEAAFNYAIISYGGVTEVELVKKNKFFNLAFADFFPTGAIVLSGGKLEINNSEISHNFIGIIAENYAGQLVIRNSEIYDNSQGGIINNSANQADAVNNWWGSDSGPYNAVSNPEGEGDSVSDNVLFDPWVKKNEISKRNPVIIVPGILGSYLSKNVEGKPEVWPNIAKMMLPGDDSYLMDLSMNSAGYPDSPSLMIPTDIFRSLYGQDFFSGLIAELEDNGYKENEDLFVFPYDWRYDIDWSAGNSPFPLIKSLKEKVDEIKQQTGAEKVDIIAHSMGGLVAKQYIKFYDVNNSIDKFIDIGTPHLGAPKTIKTLLYGDNIDIPVLNSSTIKNVSKNMLSIYQLLPSTNYFDSENANYKSYILDLYDYDGNEITGNLNYDQSKEFLKNFQNNYLLDEAENFHISMDNFNPSNHSIKAFNIVGCNRSTIGKIAILNKEKSGGWEYALYPVTGDGTVPLRSAEKLDNTLGTYYINNTDHAYLPSANGVKQLVVSLLTDNINNFSINNFSNLATSSDFCSLSGTQISFHSPIDLHIYDENNNHLGPDQDGNIEQNIDGSSYDIIDGNKFAFLPLGHSYSIVGGATDVGSFNADVRDIRKGEITKTVYFNEVALASINTKIEMDLDNENDLSNIKVDNNGDGEIDSQIKPSSILNKNQSADLTKPETSIKIIGKQGKKGIYQSFVLVILKSRDDKKGSGILKTEYSLDHGKTWNKYKHPIFVGNEGIVEILFQATDKAGNVEITRKKVINIYYKNYKDYTMIKKIMKGGGIYDN